MHKTSSFYTLTAYARKVHTTVEIQLYISRASPRPWHRLYVFLRLAPVTCFPALSTNCMFFHAGYWLHFSCPWHRLHVFPRFASVTCFLEFGTGCVLSRALNRLLVFQCLAPVVCFPRLEPVACFPALGTGCVFSRAWPQLRAFPSLAPVASFPPLAATASFPRLTQIANFFRAYQHRFPTRLALATRFPTHATNLMFSTPGRSYFSRARHKLHVFHGCCCCLE